MAFVRYNNKLATIGTKKLNVYRPFNDIMTDGNTLCYWDFSDLTTFTRDSSNYVSRWNDKYSSGRDFVQDISINRPIYDSSNGLIFDGTNSYIKTVQFSPSYSSPLYFYIVMKRITHTTTFLMDGYTQNNIGLHNGTASYVYNYIGWLIFEVGQWAVLKMLYSGVGTSKMIKNSGTPIIGNTVLTLQGITLADDGSNQANYRSNVAYKDIILRKKIEQPSDDIVITNTLRNKYSF